MSGELAFQEVTITSGINYTGESYGASWGNFNEDSYPDLWVTNHAQDSGRLYLNLGNGTFNDITNDTLLPSQDRNGDQHGAAWADFDNDGDQDLIQLIGGGRGVGFGSNRLYINNGLVLEDRASELGVDYGLSRGRTPLWFDFDRDGLLDLFVGAVPRPDGQAPPTVFRQTESGFENARSTTNFNRSFSEFGFLSDLNGDDNLDGVFSGNKFRVPLIYDITEVPFQNITTSLISHNERANDMISADFNGDLKPDLYLAQENTESDFVQDDSDTARTRIISQGDRKGISFDSSGNVRFNFNFNAGLSLSDIYIGANGFNPNNKNVTLSASDLDVEGISTHTPGVDKGIYIGYDSDKQEWQMLVSSPNKFDVSALINTSEQISNLKSIGFNPDETPSQDRLFFNTDRGLVDQSQEAGINTSPVAGKSVVSGDFDNDMDIDLYVVASGSAGNRPNILYENQGNGTFTSVPDAAGASGTNLGVGDSVVTADYDLDGFLDLFVTNGRGIRTLNKDAPYQLFRNQGNENNWLEIDLEGVVSNRDGIGAKVFVTAGGITQLREQSGGIHHRSQNHQLLHFGLGDNERVEEISIKWPNGREQKINNVSSNQLLQITEPTDSLYDPAEYNFYDRLEYNPSENSGVFLWKDSQEESWHLRVTAGDNRNRRYVGSIISDNPATSVEKVGIESHDRVDLSDPSRIDFDLRVWSGFQDGIDFSFPQGATLSLNVESLWGTSDDFLRLGAEQLLITELPIDIGNW